MFDPNATPPDTTGAVGPTRFIETVNDKFAIYDKISTTPLAQGTLIDLWGVPVHTFTTDPQVIWDPKTNRFYYAGLIITSGGDNELTIGFSTTASPSSAADFCHYFITGFGTSFLPDFPKLGDAANFGLVGVNTFNAFTQQYIESDLVAESKPPAGATCPIASSFKLGVLQNLKDSGGNQVFTPIPANEIDDVSTGFVIARNGVLPSKKLWLYKISVDTNGNPVGTARAVSVPSYAVPPGAAQGGGSTQLLATADARNTQAVVARNPARGNALSLWTQHTVAAGSTSGVRFYEIDPLTREVLPQSGTLTKTGNFFFNAAISPDRSVDGTTKQFGDSFAIGFSESSAVNNINPRIDVVSSVSGGPLSNRVTIKSSAGPYIDFSCANPGDTCRWGDYAGATPEPKPSGLTTSNIWLDNQFGNGGTSTAQANWRVEIFKIQP